MEITRNFLLVLVSCAVALFFGEGLTRLFVEEIDYLQPNTVQDSDLGHRVVPGSAGHDEWGFRNSKIPDVAEIVAIGDSMTYGWSASRKTSWPYWLGIFSNKEVYNMGLGGYGPLEYVQLLKEQATQLSPSIVLIGFYFGNDLLDAYSPTLSKKPVVDKVTVAKKHFSGLRGWLSKNSVIYQMLKLRGGFLVDSIQFHETTSSKNTELYPVANDVWRTVFAPRLRLYTMDQSIEENRIGLDLTLESFGEIDQHCDRYGVRCIFCLIPTKESVYWPMAKDQLGESGSEMISEIIRHENVVRENMVDYFVINQMEFIDLKIPMQKAARSSALYPSNTDGHPNGAGYKAIARYVWDSIRD